jgi:hypothetical protein
MPAQAFLERKYFGATLGSSIAASEHAEDPSAALGHSEVLSVKQSPRSRIPDPVQLNEDGEEVSPVVGREKSGNILPNEESRLEFIGNSGELVEEARALARETRAEPLDREVLTREAPDDDVARRQVVLPDGANVVEDLSLRELRGEELAAVRVALDDGDRLDPRALEAEVEAADSGEEGDESKWRLRRREH